MYGDFLQNLEFLHNLCKLFFAKSYNLISNFAKKNLGKSTHKCIYCQKSTYVPLQKPDFLRVQKIKIGIVKKW